MRFRFVEEYEQEAKRILPEYVYSFYSSGAETGQSLTRNKEALKRLLILPRGMQDVSSMSHSVSLLGGRITLDSPICVSPTAFHGWAHPDGEKATAKACESLRTLYAVSGASTFSIEDISQAAPKGHRWQNVYIYKERSNVPKFVRRAESCGVSAMVVSTDINMLGKKSAWKLPWDPNTTGYAHVLKSSGTWAGNYPPNDTSFHSSDAAATWDDIKWLVKLANIPVIAKGIMTPYDAEKAIEAGVSAIIVSNHGGRQLDATPASIEMLPSIVDAVQDRVEVYVDSGVRTGTDVFKCLALGAKAVFVGRPVIWGLAVDGEQGVKDVLTILKEELTVAMGLTGCTKIEEIKKDFVIRESDLYLSRL